MKGFFFSITSPPSFLLLDISLPTYRDPVNLTFSDHLSLESRGGDRDNNDWKKSEWSAKLGSISPSYMNLWSKEEISSIATQTQHDSSSNGDRNCYGFPINNALAALSSSASFSGHRIDNDYADDMDNYFRLALIVSGYIANRIREGREMLTCEEALLDHCPQSPLSLFLLFFSSARNKIPLFFFNGTHCDKSPIVYPKMHWKFSKSTKLFSFFFTFACA